MIIAATIGSTRLIDNTSVTLTEPEASWLPGRGGHRASWRRPAKLGSDDNGNRRRLAVDLEEVADELYGSSPEDFVERRTERVAEARQAGDRVVAKQISQLRRPTRTAWMVNLLARANASEITQLLDLGRALQDAQQRAAGDDLRRLSKSAQIGSGRADQASGRPGHAAGHAPTEGTVQEVSQTLQAALADPAIADLVQRGRLTQAASYGGFGPSSETSDSSADLLAALAASVGGQQDRPSPDQDQAEPDRVARPDPEVQRELEEAVRSWEAAAGERPRPPMRRTRRRPARTISPTASSRCATSSGRQRAPNARPALRHGRHASAPNSCDRGGRRRAARHGPSGEARQPSGKAASASPSRLRRVGVDGGVPSWWHSQRHDDGRGRRDRSRRRSEVAEHVLIAGATGFVGSSLAEALERAATRCWP